VTDQLMDGAEPTYTPGEAAGVLLLHDLAGSPQTLQNLAEALKETGYTIDVPLLPGHGTEIDDLVPMTWDDWSSAAQLALDELASRSGPVVVAGIGMGATLACWVAAMHPQAAGVVAINPRAVPVPQEAVDMLEAMLKDGCTMVPPLAPDVSDRSAHVVAYETVPIATLLSMFEAIGDMAGHWDELQVPTLIVTSARDHRVSPYNAEFMAEHVGGTVERLTLEHSFHIATVDVDHKQLEEAVVEFVKRVTD
jgi:carboxylesterase